MLCMIALLVAITAHAHADITGCSPRQLTKLGCYDQDFNIFDYLIMTDRDPSETTYSGKNIVWGEFEDYLQDFTCRCAEAARGYSYFAATYYGECWVAHDESKIATLLNGGKVNGCVNDTYLPCEESTKELCMGMEHFHFIYQSVLPQPTNGGYSKWSEFTECSEPCGAGVQRRTRTCTDPKPKDGGANCEALGPANETQTCIVEACAVPLTPIHGGYSTWSAYSECSKTCGKGVHFRTRRCDNPAPRHGGKKCRGVARQRRQCEVKKCPLPDYRLGGRWERIPGRMKGMVSSGQAGVWGISLRTMYYLAGTHSLDENRPAAFNWYRFKDRWICVASGFNIVWAINSRGVVFYRDGITAEQPTGSKWINPEKENKIKFKRISVNSRTNEVWAVDRRMKIWFRKGVTEENAIGTNWVQVAGQAIYISAGDAGVWITEPSSKNSLVRICYRVGTRKTTGKGTSWKRVSNLPRNRIKTVVSGHDIVLATDRRNRVYVRTGINNATPFGTGWKILRRRMRFKMLSINSYDGSIWGVNNANLIFKKMATRLVNVGYTPWSPYGRCSKKCTKTRRRRCYRNALGRPNFKCNRPLKQTVKCGPRCKQVSVQGTSRGCIANPKRSAVADGEEGDNSGQDERHDGQW